MSNDNFFSEGGYNGRHHKMFLNCFLLTNLINGTITFFVIFVFLFEETGRKTFPFSFLFQEQLLITQVCDFSNIDMFDNDDRKKNILYEASFLLTSILSVCKTGQIFQGLL